jgi:DNA repair protein RecO (recombination protein O)
MSLVETEALVLKAYNLAEADRIVIFLTRDHGIVRGVAKGAKRLKSRFGGSLEPFSEIVLTYFQKEVHELVSVRQIDLLTSHFEQASEPAFLQKFSYLADLLIAFAPPHDPNEALYRMVRACINTAAATADSLPALGVYFELWLLRLGGYLPDWSTCTECKLPFAESVGANLQISFHLICSRCRKAAGSNIVGADERALFAAALRLSPAEFVSFAAGRPAGLVRVSGVLKRIISQVIGREVTEEKSLAIGS